MFETWIIDADLRNADLRDAYLINVRLRGATVAGVDWTTARMWGRLEYGGERT